MSNSKLLSLLCCVAFAMESGEAKKPAVKTVLHVKPLKNVTLEGFSGFLGVPVVCEEVRASQCVVSKLVVPVGIVDGKLLFKLKSAYMEKVEHGLVMCGFCALPFPSPLSSTEYLEKALAVHWPLACYQRLTNSSPFSSKECRVRITHFALKNPPEVKELPSVVSVIEYVTAELDSSLPELVRVVSQSSNTSIIRTSWEKGNVVNKIEIADGKEMVLIDGVSYPVMAYFCGSVEDVYSEKTSQLFTVGPFELPFDLKAYEDSLEEDQEEDQEEELEAEKAEEAHTAPTDAKLRDRSPVRSVRNIFRQSTSPAPTPKPEQNGQDDAAPLTPGSNVPTRRGSRFRELSRGAIDSAKNTAQRAVNTAQGAAHLFTPRPTPLKLDTSHSEVPGASPASEVPGASPVVVSEVPGASPASEVPGASPVVVSVHALSEFALSSTGSNPPQGSPEATPVAKSAADSPVIDETPKLAVSILAPTPGSPAPVPAPEKQETKIAEQK